MQKCWGEEDTSRVDAGQRIVVFVVVAIAMAVLACAFSKPASARVSPETAKARHARVVRRERRVVNVAWKQLGVPYVWGGESRAGFDCSGLVRYVYRRVGISLPHYTVSQFQRGTPVALRHLKPGDLLFFYGLGHVGLYIGHGLLVHAPHAGTRVTVARLASYAGRVSGARRLIH